MHDGRFTEDTKPSGDGLTLYATPQARRPWYCVPEHCPTIECAEFSGMTPSKCKSRLESEG